MKAAVLVKQNDIRYTHVPRPEIGSEDLLVSVKATGICGSDLPCVLGQGARYYPIILGHESAVVVAEVGDQVTGVVVGDKVSGAPLLPCHKCIDCSRGHYSQCGNYSFIGSRAPGSWAEYVKLPAQNAVKLPANVDFVAGALMEPVTVAVHGLFLMGDLGGADVAVVGMGNIGLLTMQCALPLGARHIYAFDLEPVKLEIAREYGATVTINTGEPGLLQKVWDLTGGRVLNGWWKQPEWSLLKN